MFSAILCATVVSRAVTPCSANSLRGKDVSTQLHYGGSGDLLADLEQAMGVEQRQAMEERSRRIESFLQPTFLSLPRSQNGLLEPTAVRYLLHRYFVEKHGWFVSGFDTGGEAWNSTLATESLAQHVSADVAEVFNRKLAHGVDLRDAALLAASFENLVHKEAVERLRSSFHVLQVPERGAAEKDVLHALDVYMMMYISSTDHSTITRDSASLQLKRMPGRFPSWFSTLKWAHEIRKEVVSKDPTSRTTFETALKVVEQIAEGFGKWQDKECLSLKEDLGELEKSSSGRVPLSRFYEAHLEGKWEFSEHMEELRHYGILEESDAQRPTVLISNYINSASNCLVGSQYYSVCCINECESLLKHIETQVAAPSAVPSRIVELVEGLPSSTVDAPRTMDPSLVSRLGEIARQNGGTVPLHGRLFNQWLHHAYPRECPLPRVLAEGKWEPKGGQAGDQAGRRMHVMEVAWAGDAELGELPWDLDEEIFATSKSSSRAAQSPKNLMRGLMLLVAAGSMVATLKSMVVRTKESVYVLPKHKMV